MTKSGIRVDRVSIPYHVPSSGSSYGGDDFYSHMFIEDLANGLFPIGGDVNHMPVFRLSSDDLHISQTIEFAFVNYGDHTGSVRPLSSLLSAFGNRTAHGLLLRGAETFEVAPAVDANGQTVGFSVLQLDGIRRFTGLTWQTIPKDALAGATWESPQPVNRRRVQIPRDRVVQVRLPREYQGIRQGLRALRHLGSTVLNFGIQNLNPDGTGRVPYDIDELREIEQRAVASVTRSTGWNGRWTFDEAVTGYYIMRRFLRFEECKIRLRKTMVDGINRILAVAGRIGGFAAEVSLHHLPTLEEIAASRKSLAAGRSSFLEMMDQYSIHTRGRVTSQE